MDRREALKTLGATGVLLSIGAVQPASAGLPPIQFPDGICGEGMAVEQHYINVNHIATVRESGRHSILQLTGGNRFVTASSITDTVKKIDAANEDGEMFVMLEILPAVLDKFFIDLSTSRSAVRK